MTETRTITRASSRSDDGLGRSTYHEIRRYGIKLILSTVIHTNQIIFGGTALSSRLVVSRYCSHVTSATTTDGRNRDITVLFSVKLSQVNSAFHPSGVGKSSTSLHRLGLRWGVFACVGWQVSPYGKRHPVVLRWISIKNWNLLLL